MVTPITLCPGTDAKASAECGMCAENVEGVGGNASGVELSRLAGAGHRDAPAEADRSDAFEHSVFRSKESRP
jgi:hypothetical protein